MKSKELVNKIRENLRDYPIEYLEKKAKDDRYPDNIYKRLAVYNSQAYREIYEKEIPDFEISTTQVERMSKTLDTYLMENSAGDKEEDEFIKYISLYLTFILKKPLHPVGDKKNYNVYLKDDIYYCKDKLKYIHDENSLCRFCKARKESFGFF